MHRTCDILFLISTAAVWLSWQRRSSHLRSYSTLGRVSTWMGDHQQASKPFRYVTNHTGQLSLCVPRDVISLG